MKHTMTLQAGTPLSEMRETFQDTPLARFTFDETNANVTCWDRHEVEDLIVLDNGLKFKIKKASVALKVTFKQAIELFGEHFTDQRGTKRVIPSWKGTKSSFLCLPDGEGS